MIRRRDVNEMEVPESFSLSVNTRSKASPSTLILALICDEIPPSDSCKWFPKWRLNEKSIKISLSVFSDSVSLKQVSLI